MATVTVSVRSARHRELPTVSVRSGQRADGFVKVNAKSRRLYLPMTQVEFERVHDLQHRQRWALTGGAACLLFGLAMARFPFMAVLGVLIAAVSGVLWVALWLALRRLLPRIDVDGALVTLRGVHPTFAAAAAVE